MLSLRFRRVNDDFVTLNTSFDRGRGALKRTAASEGVAELFARFLAFLGRHLGPLLHHAPAAPSPGPATAPAAKSAKQDFAEHQHANCLPIEIGRAHV